jgi:hypothetical protein
MRTILPGLLAASLGLAACCPTDANQLATRDVLLDGGLPDGAIDTDLLISSGALPPEQCLRLCPSIDSVEGSAAAGARLSCGPQPVDGGDTLVRCYYVANWCVK